MRPSIALSLLALLVTGASLCNRRLPGRRRQAPSPSAYRRPLTAEEAARLSLVRDALPPVLHRRWPSITPEDAARLAMAWPDFTPDVSTRLQ